MIEVQGMLLSMRVTAKNILDIKTSRNVRQDWLIKRGVYPILLHSGTALNEVASKMVIK